MTAVPSTPATDRRATSWLWQTEVWASLAITMMWVAVALTAMFGPDITSASPGGSTTTVPSGVAVGLFATIASWAVARHGFRERVPR